MRAAASILHMDLDAFFAAVEQRDKPSLRGKPVVVGGLGPRGVVATASYEARRYGVRSAMPTAEARHRCPHAAFLAGRFGAYRAASRQVMALLAELSPVVEPLSLDEAYADLTAGGTGEDLTVPGVTAVARRLKERVREATGGLTGSVGVASSKLMAKIASDLDKPDGLVVVAPGTERDLLAPMPVGVLPGVGPATAERLRRAGARSVGEVERLGKAELVRLLGQAHGQSVHELASARDSRPVVADRESKSVSVEDTFDTDLVDPALLAAIVERHAARVCERLRAGRLSGRTVTLKVRRYDFSTHTRSATLPGPTDQARVVTRVARALLAEVDVSGGVRLLGVGVSGLADWIQEDLFEPASVSLGAVASPTPDPDADWRQAGGSGLGFHPDRGSGRAGPGASGSARRWVPGSDVVHARFGPGWVWGCGLGRVTVRFETAQTGPGPVRTFAADDPDLSPADPSE